MVGKATNYLPYFVVAWRELTEGGFGLNRARCTLSVITSLNLLGEEQIVYDVREGIVHPPRENLNWQKLRLAQSRPAKCERSHFVSSRQRR